MSQEISELFRRWAEYWNRGDLDTGLRECIHPEVEWVPFTASLEGTAYQGHEGIRRWTENLFRDLEVFEVHVDEVRDLGEDRALVTGSWRARGRGSGVELGLQQAAWLTEFRQGRIVRMRTFTDRADALQAVGLSE